MNKTDKWINIKNIVLLIILIILLGIFAYNKSFAMEYANLQNLMNWGNVGDVLSIGYSSGSAKLAGNDRNNKDTLYCVQHGASINSASLYGIVYKIRIEGNYAVSSHTVNGQNLTSYSPANAKLAYILGGGSHEYGYGTVENKTNRQKQLWNYWNTWINQSGTQLGVTWNMAGNDSVSSVGSILTEANTYSQKNITAQISSNVGQSIDSDNQMAGAFNVSYIGNISSVVVRDIYGNVITEGISYIQNNQVVNPTNILSGYDFYIENNSGRILKDVTINVSNTSKSINVDMWLLQSNKTGNQKLMAARPETVTTTQTANVTINISTNNTLRVVKYGVNGNNEYKQAGVGFVIYRDGVGYLKRNNIEGYIGREFQQGKMEYNENYFSWTNDKNAATIFETTNTDDGWTGYFQISKIPTGNYYIGEVYNKNQGYEKSTISKCILEKYKNNDIIDTTSIRNIKQNENVSGYTNNKLQVINVTLENDGYTKILRVYDSKVPEKQEEPDEFNIYINKTNLTGKTKLAGAQFKIKVLDEKGNAIGWLEKVSNKEYEYDSKFTNATIWSSTKSTAKKDNFVYADVKGEIEIKDLNTEYKYEIYEIKQADSCYALGSQITSNSKTSMSVEIDDDKFDDIEYIKAANKSTANNDYAATVATIYCGKVSYEKYGTSVDVLVTNRTSSGGGGRRRRKQQFKPISIYRW